MESISKVCMICTGVFDFPVERATFPCPACGTVNGRPMAYDPRKKPQDVTQEYRLRVLTRANRQRMRCDFDEAEKSYQQALLYHNDEHEALWGRVLCKYHVEYALLQEDEMDHRRMRPVIHRPQSKPMRLDPEFKDACSFAPADVRAVYEAEAEYIDKLMREIILRAAKSDPYDVYICHKTRRADGMGYTEDYARAQELSRRLTEAGYRVFCEPEPENEDESIAYEAEVFRALETAKVMLVAVCQSVYLTDVRVSSQWRRFLIKNEKSDALLDCLLPLLYGGMTVEQLPEDFRLRHLMCIPMETEEAFPRLMREVRRLAGSKSSEASAIGKRAGSSAAETVQHVPARNLWTDGGQRRSARSRAGDFAVIMAENSCAVGEYSGTDAVVRIPKEIGGLPVTAIADDAFTDNETVCTVIVPEGVTHIGSGAFWNCGSLTRASLPSTLIEVGRWAFSGCAQLKEAALPGGVAVIGDSAFSGCRQLRELTLPVGLRRIGHDAFKGCAALRLRVESGSYASEYVQRCGLGNVQVTGGQVRSDFRTERCEDGCAVIRYTGRESCVTVPPEVNGMTVRMIGDGAFKGCGTLEQVMLPQGLHAIGDVAFKDCVALERITLPEGLMTIGDDAFKGCQALHGLALPQSLSAIGDGAFTACRSLATLRIPEGVQHIGDRAFSGCPELTLLAAADSEAHRYASRRGVAFRSLEDVTLEEDFHLADVSGGCEVRRYAGRAARVTIPAQLQGKPVVGVGAEAFRGCGAVTEIILPETVRRIGDRAFAGCRSLRSMKLSAAVGAIGENAFEGCGQLSLTVARGSAAHDYAKRCGLDHEAEGGAGSADYRVSAVEGGCCIERYTGKDAHVVVPKEFDGKPVIEISERAFSGCAGMTGLTLPEGVTRLGMWAFSGCTALEKVTLPRSLQGIACCAFEGCRALAGLVLPEGLERIGTCAFNACTALTELALPGSVKVIEEAAFCSCPELTLVVREGSPAHARVQEMGLRFRLEGQQAAAVPAGEVQQTANAQSDFEVRDAEEGCAIVDYTGEASRVVVPQEIGGKPVVQIRPYAFADCKAQPVSIALPDTIRMIDRWSLANCHQVTEIRLPGQLTVLDDCALEGCESLTRLRLPQSLQRIGVCAFHNCASLTELTIPAGVTTIGDYAFMGCKGLTLVVEDGSAAHEYARRNNLSFRLKGQQAAAAPVQTAALPVRESVGSEADFEVHSADGGCVIEEYKGASARVIVPVEIGGKRVKRIGAKAFMCDQVEVTHIALPDGMTRTGTWAMANCRHLAECRLPASLRQIDDRAFENCVRLTQLTLPEGLETIGERAFSGCRELAELTIPAGVKTIGAYAFAGCEKLTLVVAENSPAHEYAGQNNLRFRTGVSGQSSAPAPAPAPAGDDGLFEVREATGGCAIFDYLGTSPHVTVPREIGGQPVVALKARAFQCKTPVETLVLPDTIQRLDSWALTGCPQLREVTLPAGLTTIADCALEGCTALARLTLPDSLRSIGACAFNSCGSLTELAIPAGVTAIDDSAFLGCKSLTLVVQENSPAHAFAKKNGFPFRLTSASSDPARETPVQDELFSVYGADGGCVIEEYKGASARVTVPAEIGGKRVKRIGAKAFMCDQVEVTHIALPDGMTRTGTWAMANCRHLAECRLPASLRQIDDRAFENCVRLTQLTLPEGLETIGERAFSGCRELAELTIPAGVKTIGAYAFAGCEKLMLVVAENSPAHEYAGQNNLRFRLLSGGSSPASSPEDDFVVTRTGGSCSITGYRGKGGRVIVPARIGGAAVTVIADHAFEDNAAITEIALPERVQRIGRCAFRSCAKLIGVKLPQGLTEIDNAAFERCGQLLSINVPAKAKMGRNVFRHCTRLPAEIRKLSPEGLF